MPRVTLGTLFLLFAIGACRAGQVQAPEPGGEGRAGGAGCREAKVSGEVAAGRLVDGAGRATARIEREGCRRSYLLSTTAAGRDRAPEGPRTIEERAGQPAVRTGNVLFDALYALAIEEAGQNSVSQIQDGAFSNGEPLRCPAGGCFQTGKLWTYVWTRDTAYSVDLALAALDPTRARNSLELKLSERRGGGDLQVVQDTGSGGSYPVSTDRVAWAFGARTLLAYLGGAERDAFARTAYRAIKNTVEHDRAVVFDARRGLYRGETSFLDWREQSYPPWTAEDTVGVGRSLALSTNAGHLAAIELAADLAGELGEAQASARYRRWAGKLRSAIAARFTLPETALYSSFIPGGLDPAPARRFDLLGLSLAVLSGVGTDAKARAAVAAYPWLPKGPPVLWPQQPGVPIYHNRAIWPFVTAYGLRAARRTRNDAVASHGVRSLLRGAALYLSNMENFEAATGEPWVDEGELSGPVVNSQRQLWSVAGYLSMVQDVIFGLEVTWRGIRFRPYVTRELRNSLFASADTLVLNAFPYRGKRIDVVVELPPRGEDRAGAYRVKRVELDGAPVGDAFLLPSQLSPQSLVVVTLEDAPEEASQMSLVDDLDDPRALFGPRPPAIRDLALTGAGLKVELAAASGQTGVTLNLYRDGVQVASGLPAAATFTDREVKTGDASHCYSAEAVYRSSGNASHRSEPSCFFGDSGARLRSVGGEARWLRAGETLELGRFRAEKTGEHLLRVLAANGAGPINTGVTCGVFRMRLLPGEGDAPVASGYLMVPHTGKEAWDRFLPSTLVRADLEEGKAYRIELDAADERAVNMSSFAHFERYTGGAGGAAGAENRARIQSVEIRWGLPRGAGERQ